MEREQIKLKEKDVRWLDKHGGRVQNHVEKDEQGMYVWMGDGYGKEVKIYLP